MPLLWHVRRNVAQSSRFDSDFVRSLYQGVRFRLRAQFVFATLLIRHWAAGGGGDGEVWFWDWFS